MRSPPGNAVLGALWVLVLPASLLFEVRPEIRNSGRYQSPAASVGSSRCVFDARAIFRSTPGANDRSATMMVDQRAYSRVPPTGFKVRGDRPRSFVMLDFKRLAPWRLLIVEASQRRRATGSRSDPGLWRSPHGLAWLTR